MSEKIDAISPQIWGSASSGVAAASSRTSEPGCRPARPSAQLSSRSPSWSIGATAAKRPAMRSNCAGA